MADVYKGMKTVSFETLGCRLNQYDTQWLRDEFKLKGFKIVNSNDNADVYVLNTCTVTSKASREARNLIRTQVRKSSKPFIIVTGCYAKIYSHEIEAIPGVNLIEPNPKKIVTNYLHVPLLHSIKTFESHIKAFIKIQEGCDQFCSYCVVPYTRGAPKSRSKKEIINEIKILATNGYTEFVLTGTNLGKYDGLLRLIESIEKIPDVHRLGLGSIEPIGISDTLLDFISNSPKFSRYFHIPLQSGNNDILKKMERWYTAEDYEELLERITERVPEAAIGADVIVGFPGEGETEFQNTYDLISRLPVSRLHVFRYSKRPGTKAAEFKSEVPEEIKKKRSKMLRELGNTKWEKYRARFIGKILEVHVESRLLVGLLSHGYSVGVTSNYIKVLFKYPKDTCLPAPSRFACRSGAGKISGKFVKIKIQDVDTSNTYGELVNQ